MAVQIALWGLAAGLIHFFVMGVLYGNPLVDGIYQAAAHASPAMKKWQSKPTYMMTQFLGTQIEVFIIAIAFVWLRPYIPLAGLAGTLLLGIVLAALRVYPRFWNMWIQSTYPNRLLAIEAVNGTIGTLVIVAVLGAFQS